MTGSFGPLAGAADLYAALRKAAAGLSEAEAEDFLPAALAELSAGDAGARDTAARLASVDQGLLQAVIRAGAGLAPVPQAEAVRAHLKTAETAPMFRPDVAASATVALLTGGQNPGMPAFSNRAFDAWFRETGATYGLGLYGEKRAVYAGPQFADRASAERRTIHLGIDVFAPAGTPVHAPLPGRVAYTVYNADPLDYGHTLILEHEAEGLKFWTLYGHLGGTLAGLARPGDRVARGQLIAHLGDWHENGGWSAHVHFQVMTTLLEQRSGNFFGVGHESLRDVWSDISPDPDLVLRIGAEKFCA